MSPLEKYQEKRKFALTPEPKGKKSKSVTGKLHFVVQKHQASALHYDFRIEVDGVLKSWAIPKGPSLNPADKHLAVMVEDHPYEYKDFEGVIPADNYGAGTVMVWDEGLYQPIGALASKDLSTAFAEGLEKGHLVFVLAGSKLNGEFALIRLSRGGPKNWLLIKAKDQYASGEDILLQDKSAKSGRSIEQIGAKLSIPKDVKPMFATLTDKPFDDSEWTFEIKWDGYRAITEVEGGKVRIYSRNDKDFNERFQGIYESFVGFEHDVVLDGEVVAVDEHGRSDFQLLQTYQLSGVGNLIYYVFDILFLDGEDLTHLPLRKRREILVNVLPKKSNIQFSEDVKELGSEFFEAAKKQNLEGIMAKRLNSVYQPGKRSRDWLKIKIHMQQEAIICGFTKPRGSRSGFGALILGSHQDDKLVHIGNVGTGFDQKLIELLMKKMKPLVQKKAVFPELSDNKDLITWVKPVLVCEVKFQEWTREWSMRQPVFLGLREDKDAHEVHLEGSNG